MKSKIIGKRQLLTFSLVCAFGLSVFVNWYYTNQFNNTTEPDTKNYNLGEAQLVNSNSVNTNENEYFTQANLKRTKAHDESKKHLEQIIKNNSDKETVELARKKLVEISSEIKHESDIENLIKAQLDKNCIVTMDNDGIEVIMPKKSINNETIIKIKNIILTKTDLKSEQIVIIELK